MNASLFLIKTVFVMFVFFAVGVGARAELPMSFTVIPDTASPSQVALANAAQPIADAIWEANRLAACGARDEKWLKQVTLNIEEALVSKINELHEDIRDYQYVLYSLGVKSRIANLAYWISTPTAKDCATYNLPDYVKKLERYDRSGEKRS